MKSPKQVQRYRRIFCIAVVLIVVVLAYLWNRQYIRNYDPDLLTVGGTIYNIDNTWYDSQFRNLVEHGEFTINPKYPEFAVRRTPLYPLFIGIPTYYLGGKTGGAVVLCLQIILHLIGAYLAGRTLWLLTLSRQLEIVGILIYGLCPFILIYTFYTLTESVSPFFTILFIFTFVKYQKTTAEYKNRWIVLTGVVLAMAVLVRPLMGLFALPTGIFFLLQPNTFWARIRSASIFSFSFFLVLTPWVIRNFKISQEIIITEKWYYEDPMDFGKGHTYVRAWVNAFTNPTNISVESLGYSIRNANSLQEAEAYVNNYLSYIPKWVLEINGRNRVKQGLENYAICLMDRQQQFLHKNTGLFELSERDCEKQVKIQFDEMKKELKKGNWFYYYIGVPFKTFFREAVFQSFSFPWPIINSDKQKGVLKMALKTLFFLLNAILWIGFVSMVFSRRVKIAGELKRFFGLAALIFILFHIGVFRYFETRYFLPIYPVLIIGAVLMFGTFARKNRLMP